jgi:hypothetical protein
VSTAPWTTVDRLDDPDSAYAQEAIESASHILWLLSGRKYGGVRSTREVYCQERYPDEQPVYRGSGDVRGAAPALRNGQVSNVFCSSCGGCPHVVRLRGVPIISVEEVSVGGNSVPLSQVLVHDYAEISPLTGCWGTCEDLEIAYTYGTAPPASGVHAATELANQYLWAITGDPQCSLPQRITSVSRQGVSWTLLDQQDFLEQGRTGLYVVDLFLKSVNPYNARMRPRVFSPDMPRARTRRQADTVVASRLRTRVPGSPV